MNAGDNTHKKKSHADHERSGAENTAALTGGDAFALSDPEKNAASLTELMHAGMGIPSPFMKDIYLQRQAIVGTRFQGGSDELMEDLRPGSRITFVTEPDNEYDPNAVMALDEQGRKLGYIPRLENSIIGALLRAGKNIYGIMPGEQPAGTRVAPGSERTPYSLWVDLYMKEFLLPDDMSQIPRQGYQGSYVVADFILWNDEERQISSIYAIKVINGEERDSYSSGIIKDTGEAYREAVAAFRKFTGYLPIVSHDITDEVLPVLEEAYGVQLGLPFSNRVIDTLQMAANHLPWVKNASLENLAEELGIQVVCDTHEEARCRITWRLYCRMDRSELKKKTEQKYAVRDTAHMPDAEAFKDTVSDPDRLDLSIEKYPMSDHARAVLRMNLILTLRELSHYSAEEVSELAGIDDDLFEEYRKKLAGAGGCFRPDGTDRMLYGYPQELKKTAMKKDDYWEYRLLFGAIAVYYEWLRDVRSVPVYLWQIQNQHTVIYDKSELLKFLDLKMEDIRAFTDTISEIINKKMEAAVGLPGEAGDVSSIMDSVEELMLLYKRIMTWQRCFQFICTDPENKEVIEDFAGIAEDLYAGFDELYKQCVSASRQLEMVLAGELAADQLHIHLDIPVSIDSEKAFKGLKGLI